LRKDIEENPDFSIEKDIKDLQHIYILKETRRIRNTIQSYTFWGLRECISMIREKDKINNI
jgi:hypothetical protein